MWLLPFQLIDVVMCIVHHRASGAVQHCTGVSVGTAHERYYGTNRSDELPREMWMPVSKRVPCLPLCFAVLWRALQIAMRKQLSEVTGPT